MLPVTPMPALLTQMSRLPKVSTAVSARAFMSSALVTSAVTNVAWPPRSWIRASVSAVAVLVERVRVDLLPEVGTHHRRALGGQREGDRAAVPGARAGDHRGSPFQAPPLTP